MPNKIFRNKLRNSITYAINEARDASEVEHPGLKGRIRELVTSQLLQPLLPAGYEIGTGKIIDRNGGQSSEVDVVIYNRTVLPPILYSGIDGMFPVESCYYALEVKSRVTASEVQDAIKKGRALAALAHDGAAVEGRKYLTPVVMVLFAFDTDLADESSELDRYKKYDQDWAHDPVLKVICVVGRGYWYHTDNSSWIWHPATLENDEVIDLISGVVNTVLTHPPSTRQARLGHYLMKPRPVTIVSQAKVDVHQAPS